jgi:BNR repeat protein
MNRRRFLIQSCSALVVTPQLLGAQPSFENAGETKVWAKPVLLSESMVYKHPDENPYDSQNRFGFNHAPSVTLLSDGRLLAAWFSGPFEAAVNQVILGCYSPDAGQGWGPAEVLNDFPRTSDFDPAFIQDGKRTWLFFSAGRWNRYPFVRGDNEIGAESFKTYSSHSDDGGRRWSEPRVAFEKVGCRTNGIKLSSGELLLPIYGFVGRTAGILKSTDQGKSWRRCGNIASPVGADEPTIAELSSGSVLMFLRTKDGFIWRSVSRDKGETWSAVDQTTIVAGQASHNLLRLRDGRIVLTHDACKPPMRTPLTLRVSRDDGASWGEPLTLAEVAVPGKDEEIWGRQVTYPSVAELADGALVIVWSEIVLGNRVQYGDIRSARVRV